MSNALERGLHAIELLAGKSTGLPLQQVAEALDIPPSATHRMLTCLVEQGFVRQDHQHGNYVLALKVISLALKHLSQSDMVELAKPVLDRLARLSGELVRLSIVDGDNLVWISKAQGSRSGLRYDPDAGAEAKLCCTASGLAWLSCLSNERALSWFTAKVCPNPVNTDPTRRPRLNSCLINCSSLVIKAMPQSTKVLKLALRRWLLKSAIRSNKLLASSALPVQAFA